MYEIIMKYTEACCCGGTKCEEVKATFTRRFHQEINKLASYKKSKDFIYKTWRIINPLF